MVNEQVELQGRQPALQRQRAARRHQHSGRLGLEVRRVRLAIAEHQEQQDDEAITKNAERRTRE